MCTPVPIGCLVSMQNKWEFHKKIYQLTIKYKKEKVKFKKNRFFLLEIDNLPSFSEIGKQFCHGVDGFKGNSRLIVIIIFIIEQFVVNLLEERTSRQ